MSKAKELAKELLGGIDGPVFHVPHYMARQAAAELRRLAQMETEYVSLLKAISDAEPVAWINEEQTIGPNFLKRHLSFGKYFSDNPLHYKHIPLYTLNGIKKP